MSELTYEGCITHDANTKPFTELTFDALADFARTAFNGAGRLYVGNWFAGNPCQMDMSARRITLLPAEKAIQPNPGPGIFVQ